MTFCCFYRVTAQYIPQKNGLQLVMSMLEVSKKKDSRNKNFNTAHCLFKFLMRCLLFSQILYLQNFLIFPGKAGLLLWAITLAGILVGGAILVYNTSALA